MLVCTVRNRKNATAGISIFIGRTKSLWFKSRFSLFTVMNFKSIKCVSEVSLSSSHYKLAFCSYDSTGIFFFQGYTLFWHLCLNNSGQKPCWGAYTTWVKTTNVNFRSAKDWPYWGSVPYTGNTQYVKRWVFWCPLVVSGLCMKVYVCVC